MFLLSRYKFIILTLLLCSCTKDYTKNQDEVMDAKKKVMWDYLNSSFRNSDHQNGLRMLCGYDTLELKRIDDSLFEIHLAKFRGWKKDAEIFKDTVKLTDNKKLLDSSGNQKKQILKFSNKNKVDLEVVIDKTRAFSDSINNYEYSGKIKIDHNTFKYSCDELWVK